MIHIYPNNDIAPHAIDGDGTDCWCEPEQRWHDPETGELLPEMLIIHKSSDGRELLEGAE